MKPSQFYSVDFTRVPFIFVSIFPANPLVTTTTEGPFAVFARGAISCDEHTSDVTGLASVIEGNIEFVNGLGPEGIQAFRTVERDSDGGVVKPI